MSVGCLAVLVEDFVGLLVGDKEDNSGGADVFEKMFHRR